MSKAVLISIHPEWCKKIASGQKTIEVRKTQPKFDTPFKCYIYETQGKCSIPLFVDEEGHMDFKGRGQVIGEFICDRIDTYESEFWNDDSVLNAVWLVQPDEDDPDFSYSYLIMSNEDEKQRYFEKAICMNLDTLKAYIGTDKPDKTFYGWHISDLVIYDKSRELSEFYSKAPCQYWHGNMTSILNQCFCEYPCENIWDRDICQGKRVSRPPQSWCYVEEI